MPRTSGIQACRRIKGLVPVDEDPHADHVRRGVRPLRGDQGRRQRVPPEGRARGGDRRRHQGGLRRALAHLAVHGLQAAGRVRPDQQEEPRPPLEHRRPAPDRARARGAALVARGMANSEIAHQLFISENTVKNHVRNILEKLQLHSRMEAAVYAVRAAPARPRTSEPRRLARPPDEGAAHGASPSRHRVSREPRPAPGRPPCATCSASSTASASCRSTASTSSSAATTCRSSRGWAPTTGRCSTGPATVRRAGSSSTGPTRPASCRRQTWPLLDFRMRRAPRRRLGRDAARGPRAPRASSRAVLDEVARRGPLTIAPGRGRPRPRPAPRARPVGLELVAGQDRARAPLLVRRGLERRPHHPVRAPVCRARPRPAAVPSRRWPWTPRAGRRTTRPSASSSRSRREPTAWAPSSACATTSGSRPSRPGRRSPRSSPTGPCSRPRSRAGTARPTCTGTPAGRAGCTARALLSARSTP